MIQKRADDIRGMWWQGQWCDNQRPLVAVLESLASFSLDDVDLEAAENKAEREEEQRDSIN